MIINPTIQTAQTAYGNTSSTHTTALNKKTTDNVPVFKLQSQAQDVSVTCENVIPAKYDCQTNESIASANEIGFASANTDGLIVGDAYIHYERAGSIYDIPSSELTSRLREAMSDSCFLDTEGMTKVEIYNRVQSIFTDYLGEDFLEPAIIYGGGIGTLSFSQNTFPINTYQSIDNAFSSVLGKLNVTQVDDNGHYDPSVIIAAKGYSGMSESEMRSALRNQYPENMTLKECILMSDELGKLGLETTAYGRTVVENIFTTLAVNSRGKGNTSAFAAEAKKIFDVILEGPASFDIMKKSIESNRSPDGNLVFDFNIASSENEMLKDVLSWYGGSGFYDTGMIDKLMKSLNNPASFSLSQRQ